MNGGDTEQSVVSVDVLTLRFDPQTHRVKLAVATRSTEPYRGQRALPGVLLLRGERLDDACARALRTKLGLSATTASGQLATFDEPSRDPRGPTLSLALWAVAAHDATTGPAVEWVDLDAVPPLAFDHSRIVADTRPMLAALLWRDRDFTRALTGDSFPVADAVGLQASLDAVMPDRGNLNRVLRSTTGLTRTGEVRQVYGSGRPSSVWAWR